MSTISMSSKGQIVLPAAIRRQLGLAAGTRLNVVADVDGTVTLKPIHAVAAQDVLALAGLVRAPSRGRPRDLGEFDAAHWVETTPRKRSP